MELEKRQTQDWTVLLVDDEEDIRDVIGMSMEDMGYRVLLAENGRQALETYREQRPPIVMTDIKMPIMDGIELLQRIKRENPDAEVVMITGHGDMDLAVRSLKHEATDFITKPINVDALEIALRRVRDRIVMRRQLKAYTESLEALIREKIELQDHLSSLGLMIGSISHGIKGLLTGLDGGMYLVESGFTKDNQEQIREGWETVKLMVERIRKMVLNILFYAKERDLNWERVNVLRFIEELTSVVRPKIESAGIEFTCSVDETLGEIEIDPGFVHSALVNILENAIDACARDQSKVEHRIDLEVRQQSDHIVFEVCDDGIGMDAETVSKLFTPFFSSKGRGGTGLGLFISNKIIQQHDGEIRVTSTPGHGSRFTIDIPKNPPEGSSTPSTSRAATPA